MNSLNRTYEELNDAIGEWNPPTTGNIVDFPVDEPLPWDELLDGTAVAPLDDDGDSGSENGHLTDDERSRLGNAVQTHGFEALAFYKSFRRKTIPPYASKWGIFYLQKGIDFLGEALSNSIGPFLPFNKLAVQFLRAHERYHFKIDSLTLAIEPPLTKHLYLPYRHAYRRSPSHCVEEALANLQAWKWAINQEKRIRGIRNFAEDIMDSQPNSYSRYRENPLYLSAELAENIVNGNYGKSLAPSLAGWAIDTTSLINYRVPEFRIYGASVSRLYPAAVRVPSVKEIRDGSINIRDNGLKRSWLNAKKKVIQYSADGQLDKLRQRGPDFKFWRPPDVYSFRVDDNRRAHVKPIDKDMGIWKLIEFGPHDKMGH